MNPFLLSGVVRTADEDYPDENVRPWRSGSGHLPTHETGIHMFHEQLPVVDPAEPNPITYRTFRVSKSLQVWFVEGRDYRSPNDMPDGPGKTIWGAKQKAWLQRTLLESDAPFKILFSATPMVGPDSISKRDNHVNRRGFRHEGDEFFRWLTTSGFRDKNFYIVCGDRHWQYTPCIPAVSRSFPAEHSLMPIRSLAAVPAMPTRLIPKARSGISITTSSPRAVSSSSRSSLLRLAAGPMQPSSSLTNKECVSTATASVRTE